MTSFSRISPPEPKPRQKVEPQIVQLLFQLTQVDVSEVYSEPRIVAEAHRFGLKPGSSLDVRTCDTDGLPWDFSKPMMG